MKIPSEYEFTAVCVAVKGADWMDVSKRESPTASSFYSIIERNATPAHARGFGRFSAPHEDGIARSGLITNPVIATRNLRFNIIVFLSPTLIRLHVVLGIRSRCFEQLWYSYSRWRIICHG